MKNPGRLGLPASGVNLFVKNRALLLLPPEENEKKRGFNGFWFVLLGCF